MLLLPINTTLKVMQQPRFLSMNFTLGKTTEANEISEITACIGQGSHVEVCLLEPCTRARACVGVCAALCVLVLGLK